MIKIALIGTHGVGKTTTAYGIGHILKKLRYDTEVLYETARKCPLPINKMGSKDSQLWILSKQLEQESLINSKIDFAICDRSVLDIYVYSKMNNPKFAESLLPFILEHMKTYDFIFYLPIKEGYLKSDNKRSSDAQYQSEIDDGMIKAIDMLVKHGIVNVVKMENNDSVADSIVNHILTKR